jgi:BirA family transcriptional regulator, biotin operon repressor / biotin---[acetyl-CoA-carboxylase] ligase
MADTAEERRQRVTAALAAAGEAGLSGEALARELGCSRAAVHRHVDALRRGGLEVEGGPTGYRLMGHPDLILPSLVEPRLTAPLAGPVEWHATIGSTNDEATRRARAGAPEGLVIGSDHQSAGRGRRGRVWTDRPGDALMFSLVLRPPIAPVDAGLLPLLVAVGLADAFAPLTAHEVQIAWPNDVIVNRRKVAGILMELSGDHERVSHVVAGIGINVRSAPDIPEARWLPGSLADVGIDVSRADLFVAVLTAIAARYRTLLSDGPGAVVDAYAARDLLAGHPVTLSMDDGTLIGTGAGVDTLGRLRLTTKDGETRIAAGEVVGVGR